MESFIYLLQAAGSPTGFGEGFCKGVDSHVVIFLLKIPKGMGMAGVAAWGFVLVVVCVLVVM